MLPWEGSCRVWGEARARPYTPLLAGPTRSPTRTLASPAPTQIFRYACTSPFLVSSFNDSAVPQQQQVMGSASGTGQDEAEGTERGQELWATTERQPSPQISSQRRQFIKRVQHAGWAAESGALGGGIPHKAANE